MLPVGHKNFLAVDEIVTILGPDSAAAKRLKHNAAEFGLLITATNGRPTRSLIVMETNHVILSALTTNTLKARLDKFNLRKKKGAIYL